MTTEIAGNPGRLSTYYTLHFTLVSKVKSGYYYYFPGLCYKICLIRNKQKPIRLEIITNDSLGFTITTIVLGVCPQGWLTIQTTMHDIPNPACKITWTRMHGMAQLTVTLVSISDPHTWRRRRRRRRRRANYSGIETITRIAVNA